MQRNYFACDGILRIDGTPKKIYTRESDIQFQVTSDGKGQVILPKIVDVHIFFEVKNNFSKKYTGATVLFTSKLCSSQKMVTCIK